MKAHVKCNKKLYQTLFSHESVYIVYISLYTPHIKNFRNGLFLNILFLEYLSNEMPNIVKAENRTIDIVCVQIATTSLKTKFNEYDTKKSGEIFFDDFCSMFQVSLKF